MVRKLRALPALDRPREKLRRKGPSALSDFELIEVLIGSGNQTTDVSQIAREVQKLLAKNAHNISSEALQQIKGVSAATSSRLLAALELARRYLIKDLQPVITEADILARFGSIRTKKQEHLVALSLDGGRRLIAERTITIGTLDTLLAHPREIFADAIAERAASIIIGHNHPSDEVEPSERDIALTQQLIASGQLLGIPLLDHMIVTKSKHFSFKQHHLM
ncbi:MAG: DNA repair protein RadC [Candidatus Saccharibacteria bacterium]|nr:DNA repair protein RadC [Candidatus Saccharibacteria bacterium]